MAQSDQLKLQVREYILLHPNAKNAEIMDKLGVSMRTVSNVRAELRAQGMPPAWGDRKTIPPKKVNATETVARATEGTFDVQTTADLNKAVGIELEREAAANAAADAELGPDGEIDISKLKRILWRVANRNVDDRIVVAAASALARIQAEANARPPGPQKPMTRGEAFSRLSMLFHPIGIKDVFEAVVRTFGVSAVLEIVLRWVSEIKNGVSLQAEKAVGQGQFTPAASELAGSPDDKPETSNQA